MIITVVTAKTFGYDIEIGVDVSGGAGVDSDGRWGGDHAELGNQRVLREG